ncbi:sulfurtransferase TusA family protein [Intrasporangium sp.]|uniref:sulfurtransferase TusA family protein n=1 Tax=Intrasporangium sp. TaxID=1925024 RepID=UPI00293A3F38|nr:sulfurtransferase TusA family protein [Intrasporangium sp.]MDV3220599.1 sulfurtransferase TusA family protein [Intrasporangium sp.]
MDYQIDVTIDAKGKKCPMPVLLTSRGIKNLQSGQVMLVEATDGGSKSDIPSWAKDTGNELLEMSSDNGVHRYVIRKS